MTRRFKWMGGLVGVLLAGCGSDPNGPTVQITQQPAAQPNSQPPTTSTAPSCPGARHGQRVLVDATHDGGVWWFPQAGPFDPGGPHQGKALADYFRGKGHEVVELGRGAVITDSLLSGFARVIRAGNYGSYRSAELSAYSWFVSCPGTTLVLLGEFVRDGRQDDLASSFGLSLGGMVGGTITRFATHPLTTGARPVNYMVGSILSTPASSNVRVLGWLETGEAVMGVVEHATAKIFFMGDTNTMEQVPQPLTDNLLAWGF